MAKGEIDSTDSKIIGFLKKDSRMSYTKIGKEIGITEGAVRKRVQGLVESDVIKKFTIDVEEKGKVRTLLLVKLDTKIPNPQVAKSILPLKCVDRVYEIAGEYDLVVHLSASNINDLNVSVDEVRAVRGIEGTNTVLILKEWY